MTRLSLRFATALTLWIAATPPSRAAEPPSDVRITNPFNFNGVHVELSWTDNSDDEDGFEVEIRTTPDTSTPAAGSLVTVPDQTWTFFIITVPNTFGWELYLRVRAKSTASGDSPWSDVVMTTLPTTDTGLRAGQFHGGTVGEPIEPYTPPPPAEPITSPVTSYSADRLPEGLAIDPTTGQITGTPQSAGFFRPVITGSDGTSTTSTFLMLRFIEPRSGPQVTTPLPDIALEITDPPNVALVELDQHLTDPGTDSAVRLETNRGTIDVILYPAAAELTVANFLRYLRQGDYDDSVFHRTATVATAGVDIIQAGWFSPGPGDAYTSISTAPPIPNEPGLPNSRGTIAMAKTSNPNSATSQIYFNTQANPGLDTSENSGGFTVFGRASDPSLPVVDDILALPRGSYTVTLDGGDRTISGWPTNTTLDPGSDPGPGDLVQVLSATELDDPLTYAVSAAPHPAIATASVSGSFLTVSPIGPGATGVELTATDLDGETTTASFAVTVSGSFAHWADGWEFPGGLDAPGDDGEGDGFNNALEYAFLGDPTAADAGSIAPDAAGGTTFAIAFTHRRWAPDLAYTVESSVDLTTWTKVWETADGLGADAVTVLDESADAWQLAVAAPAPPAGTGRLYLRVRVVVTIPDAPPGDG